MDGRWIILAPSALLVLLTVPLWLLYPPPAAEARASLPVLVLLGLATAVALLGAAALLERVSPSFRSTSRRLERLVRDLRLGRRAGAGLALATGVAEELFFRGWLLHVLGLWGQALLFMALHPAGRRGWAYTLFTGVAGLVFGALTLATGSVVSALVAHVAVNAHGFASVTRPRDRTGGGAPPRDGPRAEPSPPRS